MKIVGNIIVISAVLVLFMGAAQLMQFKKVFSSARNTVLTNYEKSSLENKAIVTNFKSECLAEFNLDNSMAKFIVDTHNCGVEIGAIGLADLVKKSDESFSDISFPLSLFIR